MGHSWASKLEGLEDAQDERAESLIHYKVSGDSFFPWLIFFSEEVIERINHGGGVSLRLGDKRYSNEDS